MALSLDTELYPNVRRVLDPTLAEDALPDSLIGSDFYAGEAARAVLAIYPTADVATGATEATVQRALVYYTAAYLAEVMPTVVDMQQKDHRARMERETPEQKRSRLLRLGAQTLAGLATTDDTSLMPPFLVVAPAGRSS